MVLDWLQFILEFDMEVHHKPGFQNILPHHLSHMYNLLDMDSKLKSKKKRAVLCVRRGEREGEEMEEDELVRVWSEEGGGELERGKETEEVREKVGATEYEERLRELEGSLERSNEKLRVEVDEEEVGV
jgi:hypothetical protein